MNLRVPSAQVNAEVKKSLFKLKPVRRDGLLLSVLHHSKANTKVRFIHCCFHETGYIIALADNDGHFYVVDYSTCKFWALPKLDSCTFIKYSSFKQHEILCGRRNGDIYVINSDTGYVTGKLQGHKYPVNYVSFAKKIYCLSSSEPEAIIWDLQTNTKLQVLTLEENYYLKKVVFMPVSNNILACFKDDLIQIWNSNNFEAIKQFVPINWSSFSIRNIIFSRNGQIMIIGGYLPTLAIFLLDKWKLSKLVSLPDYIYTLRSIEFISQPFDGGCNKIIAILSGQGIVYFFDIEQNIILSELTTTSKIIKIHCCPNGNYIACVLCSGEVELFSLSPYIMPPIDVKVEKVKTSSTKIKPRYCIEKIQMIKSEIKEILDIDKLKAILQEYQEYPEVHRLKIWEKLLQLPNNIKQYNTIINRVTRVAFEDLYTQYPLESKMSIKCLKKLLNNMVTWCPFFAHLDYLPVFAFPFVKVFQNKPVACFEAVCTVILNWCQHWFEYFPLAPVNILAMVENMLMEHDPDLLYHFSSFDITANTYAWPLLETAFSEVLTAPEWLALWDHVFTNEPSFLLCVVTSYNIVHRDILLSLKDLKDFDLFYHNQNPNNTKQFLKKSYYILNNTSDKLNPRQYLEAFSSIKRGSYPLFIKFPKTIIDFQVQSKNRIHKEISDIGSHELELIEQAKKEKRKSEADKMQMEEIRRQREMEQASEEALNKGRLKIKLKHEELQHLRKLLGEEEQKVFCSTHENLSHSKRKSSSRISKDDAKCCERCLTKVQENYINKYAELLKHKYRIKELVDKSEPEGADAKNKLLQKYQQELQEEINKIRISIVSPQKLKTLNIATSIVVMENLIKHIEQEIQQESNSRISNGTPTRTDINELQLEVGECEEQIAKLVEVMNKIEGREDSAQVREHGYLHSSVTGGFFGGEDKSPCECCCKTVRFSNSTRKN